MICRAAPARLRGHGRRRAWRPGRSRPLPTATVHAPPGGAVRDGGRTSAGSRSAPTIPRRSPLARAIARLVRLAVRLGQRPRRRCGRNLLATRRGLPPIVLDCARGAATRCGSRRAGGRPPTAGAGGGNRLGAQSRTASACRRADRIRCSRWRRSAAPTGLQSCAAGTPARRPARGPALQSASWVAAYRAQRDHGELCRADERVRMKQPVVA